jgi:MFS family permease
LAIKLSDLTVWGWLLALAAVGVIVGGMMPWAGWLYDVLPRTLYSIKVHYPAELLALPVLLLGIGVFALGAVVLNACGLPVVRKRSDNRSGS